jgi:hypothetical protein
VLGYLKIDHVDWHNWNHRLVMFRHSKLFLPHFYYGYIILKKSRFILKGLRYHLVLIFGISAHPLKIQKIKLYNAVGSCLTKEHGLESVRGEFWDWYERGSSRNNFVNKNILLYCDHWPLLKNQRCATSAGHVAGTEAMKVEINFTRKLEVVIQETKM